MAPFLPERWTSQLQTPIEMMATRVARRGSVSEMAAADVPSLADLEEAWAEAQIQDAFWREHQHELLAKYPDQFVAMRRDKIVASSPKLQTVLEQLEQRGIDRADVRIRFVSLDPRRYML